MDRPLLTRYLSWIGGLLHGNFGTSYTYRTAVEPFVRAALINSVKLAALAFVIVVPLGIIGGVIAALYEGRASRPDYFCDRTFPLRDTRVRDPASCSS